MPILSSLARLSGSLPKNNTRPASIPFLLVFFCLFSCKAEETLGITRAEVAKRLRAGDISFVVQADPKKLPELASYDPKAPFFVALRAESLNVDPSLRAALFALSWANTEGFVRVETGRRLIETEISLSRSRDGTPIDTAKLIATARRFLRDYPNDPDGRGLLAAALLPAGEYAAVRALFPEGHPAETEKERAAELLAAASAGTIDAITLVERFFLDAPIGDEYERTYAELMKLRPQALLAEPGMREIERAARARLAVSKRSFKEAESLFSSLLADNPSFVLSHPELLGDSGRAFQYGESPKENAARFESLAKNIADDGVRFRLFFYAGRMLRQIGDREKANLLFSEALPLSPDSVQRDACFWYILDGAMALSPISALTPLKRYAPIWKTPDFFSDLLDRYCGQLVAGKYWPELMETFRILKPTADSATVARYAYVIGRAVSLGYIGADRPREFPAKLENGEQLDDAARAEIARSFFRIAFEADEASFYYRCLAASRLGGKP